MMSRFSFCRAFLIVALAACAAWPGPALSQSAFDDPGARGGTNNAAGGIVAVSPSIDGGAVPIGATAQVVVRFRNEGSRPVQTGAINLYPSSTVSASILMNQCVQEPLPSGAECAMAIGVKGLQPGPWRVEMLMRHDGRTRLVTAALSGTVDAGDGKQSQLNDVESIPTSLDFGSLSASRSLIKSVILRNITSNAIDIKDVSIEANPQAGYSLRTDCTKLEAGQACIVTVTWSPVQKGPASGVLVVDHSGPTGVVSVALTGEYAPAAVDAAQMFPEAVPGQGLLVSSQEQIDFGADISSKSAMSVSLVNVGDAQLVIDDIRLAGKDSGLTIESKGCQPGTMLDPIQACPLTLSWAPVREGSLLDDVQILHNGVRGTLVIPVKGSAKAAVSQDSQAILLNSPGMMLNASELKGKGEPAPAPEKETSKKKDDDESEGLPNTVKNKTKALDGYVVTSFAPTRAIIAGPSGSRVVFNHDQVVIGGVMWDVKMRRSGVEFTSGDDKVLLLFDKSLSSVNRTQGQSVSGGGGSGSGSASSGSGSGSASSTGSSSGSSSATAGK